MILFSMGIVAALEIQAPAKVVSYAPFTFRVILPSTEFFAQANVYFDNFLVATIYPSGTCVVQPDWIPFVLRCAAFDADPKTNEGLTTILTHTGFSKSPHTIFVSTQGSQSENQLFTVNVFDAVDEESQLAVQTKIDSTDQRVTTLETENVKTQENLYAAQSDLTKEITTTKEKVEKLDLQLNPPQTEEPPQPAGFSIPFLSNVFGNGSPATGLVGGISAPIVGIGIIVAAALAFLFIRSRGKSSSGFGGNPSKPSAPFFEGTLDSLFKNVPGKTSEGPMEAQPKKWSSDVETELREDIDQNPPERDTKIHYKDLVR